MTRLVAAMTQGDPTARPSAEEAWRIWKDERQRVNEFSSQWPLKPRTEPFFDRLFVDVRTLYDIFRVWSLAMFLWVAGG